jgi:hypoxanthine phosphoribosyltransferase
VRHKILIQTDRISARVAELGKKISQDYRGETVLLVGVLNGALFFLTDLARAIDPNHVVVTLDTIAASSYGSGTESAGEVWIRKDLVQPVNDRHVIIIEDIVDTGYTVTEIMALIAGRNPKSLKVCGLLSKPSRRKVEVEITYLGFEIPDKFVVGYGLDHDEEFRNLPFIAVSPRA